MLRLDHIALSGTTLPEATAAVEDALGVRMQPGGQHDVFGTHNTLLGLADGFYIEAIAADPAAPVPERPRWFDLDRFEGAARLTNWICATDDLPEMLSRLPKQAGEPVSLRRGDLRWQMAVPDDGILPFDGLHPALICWRSPVHPASILAPSGCRLRRLIVSHPLSQELAATLGPVLNDDRIAYETGAPALRAEIETPHGLRVLQ